MEGHVVSNIVVALVGIGFLLVARAVRRSRFWSDAFRELRRRRSDPGLARSAIRKWLTSVAMLVASALLAGDLVSALGGILNGEASAAFILKCAVVAVISGGVLLVYIRDFRNDGT